MAHRDGYTAFVSSGVGKRLATTLGLPQPVPLRRKAGLLQQRDITGQFPERHRLG